MEQVDHDLPRAHGIRLLSYTISTQGDEAAAFPMLPLCPAAGAQNQQYACIGQHTLNVVSHVNPQLVTGHACKPAVTTSGNNEQLCTT